ncbi:S-adenosyl-L-homocysteine hydrolase [Sulfitobacter sp.]|uniref:S-adenosyl-L-homocysteine hydrolase n=1 Tax=Sulfitobacter sp. TaxID=1903071 RepID=UPI003297D3D5
MKTAMTALAAVVAFSTAATAQQACMSHTEMQSSLIDWYGEEPVSGPMEDNLRLWVSDQTGTWTLVRSMADGNACVEAQGRNWSAGMDTQDVMAAIDARTKS